jgi:hypothetical protein
MEPPSYLPVFIFSFRNLSLSLSAVDYNRLSSPHPANHFLAAITLLIGRRNTTTIVALFISPQATQQATQQAI